MATDEKLDELELLELLEDDELEQLLELDELELELKLLLELLLELEQLDEVSIGLKGVVRSPPQPCNKITTTKQNNAVVIEFDWRPNKLIIRV
jgi:sporulation-control protein spo0M